MEKRIVIFGATGQTGIQLVKEALGQNYLVTAFVRDPAKLQITHENLKVVTGDVRNPRDVDKAVEGHDAVLSVLGTKPFHKPICALGILNIITAMKEHNVQRLIAESAHGARESNKEISTMILRLVLRPVMKDKDEMENIIENSGLEWVVVRPTMLTNGQRTGTYRVGTDFKAGGFAKISRADVADLMIKSISEDHFLHQFVTITY